MPLYTSVDFGAAYQTNQGGRLSADQMTALTHLLKSRKIVGLGLFLVDALMALLFGSVLLTSDWSQGLNANIVFIIGVVLCLAGAVYGWGMWRSAKKAAVELPNTIVTKIVGEAQKYNFGTAVPVAGATHTLVLRHGYIKLNGTKYGVLNPQLYGEIVDGKKTDFYLVPIVSTGFAKGVVVNCSN